MFSGSEFFCKKNMIGLCSVDGNASGEIGAIHNVISPKGICM